MGFLESNPTFARYIQRYIEVLAGDHRNRFYFTIANLFLHEHGIEVAIRLVLYLREAVGDSDVIDRLLRLGRITGSQSRLSSNFVLRKCFWHG